LALALVTSCGGSEEIDPEAQHCARAFERITKDVRERERAGERIWSVGDRKSVAITYDGIYGPSDTGLRDILTCTYLVPVGTVTGKNARVDAIDILVRGKHLSEAELILLNTAIHVSRPKLLP